MFNNTVNLKDVLENTKAVHLINGPTDGKTVRRSTDKSRLMTITIGESNENPGLTTQRSNVRVSMTHEIEDTGKTATSYVQLTISNVENVATGAEVQSLAAQLINFLINGDQTPGEVVVDFATLTAIPRLLAGEP